MLPAATVADLILNPDQIAALTGYRRPADQLRELHRQGFHRARRSPAGTVILERAHYEAVCRGDAQQQPRPKVRMPALRVA